MPELARELKVVDAAGNATFRVDGNGKIILSDFIIENKSGTEIFHVDKYGRLILEKLVVINKSGEEIFHVDKNGKVYIGKSRTAGEIFIRDEDGKTYAFFQPSSLLLYDNANNKHRLSIGINALGHALGVYRKNGGGKATVSLDGIKNEIRLRSNNGKSRVLIEAKEANMWLGGTDADGDIFLFPRNAVVGNYKNIDSRLSTIHLDGDAGDITLRNADCAEDFEVMDGQEVEPGSVMVIEKDEKLCQSTKAYDKRVAGVISGAGGNKPGIVLGRIHSNGKAMPIALTGKVFCKVDAGQAPIQVGDLLTTSDILGHAMKATNHAKAFGTIIGKALQSLDKGRGLVPILVALQ